MKKQLDTEKSQTVTSGHSVWRQWSLVKELLTGSCFGYWSSWNVRHRSETPKHDYNNLPVEFGHLPVSSSPYYSDKNIMFCSGWVYSCMWASGRKANNMVVTYFSGALGMIKEEIVNWGILLRWGSSLWNVSSFHKKNWNCLVLWHNF